MFTCNIFSLNKQNQSRVKGTKQKQIIDTRFLSISNAVLPCDYIPTYPCKIRHTRCSVALSGPNSLIFFQFSTYLLTYLCPKYFVPVCLKSLNYLFVSIHQTDISKTNMYYLLLGTEVGMHFLWRGRGLIA